MKSTSRSAEDTARPRIVIVGAGYVGMYVAHHLQRKLSRKKAEITVIDPESYMTYQPFLPETAAGNMEPRHVVVSLRRLLKRCELINARVTSVNHDERKVRFTSLAGEKREMSYNILVMCLGSIVRTLPVPGLADFGISIQTVGEAVWLRNHVLTQLDIAASTNDPKVRERALTFMVVGGGYAGVETLAELEDLSRTVTRYYTKNRWSKLQPAELRWVLVEATGRILPEVG
ncbi:MAG: NAD(P)/FAD-dependent oxidoreductase, partial [Terriglobales bacterium]